MEQQVTYPITPTVLAVPGADAVRGYSFFGDSYVCVIFEDGAGGELPPATASASPGSTGTCCAPSSGWPG